MKAVYETYSFEDVRECQCLVDGVPHTKMVNKRMKHDKHSKTVCLSAGGWCGTCVVGAEGESRLCVPEIIW